MSVPGIGANQLEILSKPDDLPIHSVVFGQMEVTIFPAQWVKDVKFAGWRGGSGSTAARNEHNASTIGRRRE